MGKVPEQMALKFSNIIFSFRDMREQNTDRQTDRQRYIQTDRQTELKYYIEDVDVTSVMLFR